MGGRSRAAAQLLAGQGFRDVYNLTGGIKAWQGQKAAGPAELGMILLTGHETPTDILILAYGMEEGLRGFYETIAGKSQDEALSSLLSRLAGIEAGHKARLHRLYLTFDPGPREQEDFEDKVVSKNMEGGFTSEEFVEHNKAALQSASHVLDLSMMLETQALDLYMRYSQKSRDDRTRSVLYGLAEEEKAHLATLGRFIDARA
ncbi:MAG: sulfurtransferase [Deltaproteobacteria bacterium]|nr:sulfurtransferase [Deltaproteobacteria bacterium]